MRVSSLTGWTLQFLENLKGLPYPCNRQTP
jgi:hypothetical protein